MIILSYVRFNAKQLMLIILFSIFLSTFAHAQSYMINSSGGYTAILGDIAAADPNNPTPDPNTVWNQISFWELPLWIQITYILTSILALAGLIKAFPIILGVLKNILNNKNRQTIYEYIEKNQGCNVADISNDHGMNRGTVNYHISKLISKDAVVSKKTGKLSQLFTKSYKPNNLENLIKIHLKNDTSKNLLLYIMDSPGVTNLDLSSKFNLDKGTIHWHLEKYYQDGLVDFKIDGKFKRCFLKPEVKNALSRILQGNTCKAITKQNALKE